MLCRELGSSPTRNGNGHRGKWSTEFASCICIKGSEEEDAIKASTAVPSLGTSGSNAGKAVEFEAQSGSSAGATDGSQQEDRLRKSD